MTRDARDVRDARAVGVASGSDAGPSPGVGGPDVSVVVPTFERAASLPAVVDGWRAQLPVGTTAEILVVDDGSEDGTQEVLGDLARRTDERATLRVLRQDNRGLAAARNHGIAVAQGELLLFSDDDMVPRSPDLLQRHLDAQAVRPGAWVSRLVVPDDCVETPFQAYWRRRLHGGTERIEAGADLGKGGFWFATLSIPRRILAEERFSTAFGGYGWEEHELGYRLHRRGVRARFLREAEIEHRDRVRFDAMRDKFRSMGRAAWTFTRLHPTLEVGTWTGTHRVSRALRALLRYEGRAAALAERDPATLTDREFGVCLEAAYTRGLAEGRRDRDRSRRASGR